MTRVVALMLCAVFGLGAPAFAQTCDVTVSGKAGDVTVMRDAQGATALWVVERGVMHGEESRQFARPSLELDFALKADGSLGAVQRLEIGITRISDLETGQTPSLRGVEMKAQLDDGRVLTARASDSGDLQRELLQAMQKTWPRKLEARLVTAGDGGVLASAVFDLTMLDAASALARQAIGKCRG